MKLKLIIFIFLSLFSLKCLTSDAEKKINKKDIARAKTIEKIFKDFFKERNEKACVECLLEYDFLAYKLDCYTAIHLIILDLVGPLIKGKEDEAFWRQVANKFKEEHRLKNFPIQSGQLLQAFNNAFIKQDMNKCLRTFSDLQALSGCNNKIKFAEFDKVFLQKFIDEWERYKSPEQGSLEFTINQQFDIRTANQAQVIDFLNSLNR